MEELNILDLSNLKNQFTLVGQFMKGIKKSSDEFFSNIILGREWKNSSDDFFMPS